MNAQPSRAGPTVGLLVKTYPKLSETFVLGEILGLERQGVQLHLFALARPRERLRHDSVEGVRAPVSYLPAWRWVPPVRIGLDLARLLLTSPRRCLRTLRFLRRRPEPGRWRDGLNAAWLASRMREAGVRHLHSHFIDTPTGLAELAEMLGGVGFSISAHAKDIYLSTPQVLRRKLIAARFCVTCTAYNRRHLQRIGGRQATVRLAYHGINLQRFGADPQPPADDQPPLILSVGRYREKKGFATLVDACRRLSDAGHRYRCEIVGYGPDHDRLQAQIERLGLAREVALVQPLAHQQLVERYRRARLFALPARVARDGDRDGIPNVLLEALAMELPVVSTRVSGIPEVIVDGVTGLLVPADDPQALAAAMTRLLANPITARALGVSGRRLVCERFTPERNLAPLRQMLLECCSPRARAMLRPALAGARIDRRYA